MKVLWFSNSPCGSVMRNKTAAVKSGGWLISLESELKKVDGLQLEVAFFSDKKESPFSFDGVKYYPICRNVLDASKGINRIRERFLPFSARDAKALPLMLDVIKQSKPDLIHIHGTEEAFGLIAEHINDIPIVFSIQGMIAPYKEKYFSGISQAYAYKLDSLTDRIKGLGIRTQYNFFCYRAMRERRYLSNARYIFGRTFWDEYCTLTLNPQRKYYVVNEILRREFYLKLWKGTLSNEKLQIISTISGGIYKGLETVLRTALQLRQYGKIDFEWHIAGYSPKSKWVHICEKMTGIKANDNNITFHGRIGADELADLLCRSDIYVHVSHIENSPNSVCEAMMVGMPVIASYAGGTASLLEHEKEGILCQDGDPYVLAGAIIDFKQHPDKALQYASAARKRATSRHDKETIVKELLDGYAKILEDYRNASA